MVKLSRSDFNGAVRQARSYTAEEVGRIVIEVPEDSSISDFEGEEGDPKSGMA